MKYRVMLLAALIAPFFMCHSGMAAEVTKKVDVVTLTKLCQECLLHCAKNREYDEISLEWCAKKVCHDVCKIEEE